jgi:hypothetical protein
VPHLLPGPFLQMNAADTAFSNNAVKYFYDDISY